MLPHRVLLIVTAAALLSPFAMGGGALPVNAVVNGDFELYTDQGVETPADDVLDTCVGIGHQVYYGEETVQADLADRQDPAGAADRVTADPAEEAARHAGVGYCVYSTDDGYDLVWAVPSAQAQRPAVGWSFDLSPGVEWGDFDGDGDREAKFPTGVGSGHNMWQSYASSNQAFTADFDAFEFTIENGAVPQGAVVLSLSMTPLAAQSADVPYYFECQITFSVTQIRDSVGVDGRVSMDPADATFRSRNAACNELDAQWDSATNAERHVILGQLRVVQLSFWNFNRGPTDTIVDEVAMTWSRSAVEAAAGPAVAVPFTSPAPLPCAIYGADLDADGQADELHVQNCEWTLHRGGTFGRIAGEDAVVPLP